MYTSEYRQHEAAQTERIHLICTLALRVADYLLLLTVSWLWARWSSEPLGGSLNTSVFVAIFIPADQSSTLVLGFLFLALFCPYLRLWCCCSQQLDTPASERTEPEVESLRFHFFFKSFETMLESSAGRVRNGRDCVPVKWPRGHPETIALINYT